MKFQNIQYLKFQWLKNATQDGGAQDEVINKKTSSQLVIHCQTSKLGRLWTSMTQDELLKIINKDHGLYEVITQYPHKVYFDIDKDEKTGPEYLTKLTDKINELFPDPDMAISGSITEEKTSYHIILNHYLIDSEEERNQLKHIVQYLKSHCDDGFDNKVYTKNRNMKLMNQSKQDGRVQEIIMNNDPKKHIITGFMIDEYYPIPQFEEGDEEETPQPIKDIKLKIDIDKSFLPFDLGSLPKFEKMKLPENLDYNNLSNLEILQLLPLNKSFDHAYTHRAARFCFYNQLSFENFISWYSQKSTEPSKIKKWQTKWHQLNQFPPMSVGAITSMLLKYYPEIKREKGYQKFVNLFTLEPENIIKVNQLNQEVFHHNDNKFVCFNTGMGSGKTFQAIEYLKNQDSFIWLAPIEALAQNTMHRLEQNNINCKYYKDFKNSKEKHDKLADYDKMIICINSLAYTQNKKYKIVVVDEIETLLNKWFNNTTFRNKKDCWERFLDIIKNADRVIFLDAFTSKLTTDFINQFQNNKYTIYELISEPITRNIQEMASVSNWFHEIISTIKSGKKAFIFYPYLRRHNQYPSMEELKLKLQEKTSTKGICYNSQVDDEVLKGLKNVNESWSDSNCSFVITNTKITVGINYEIKDFHQVFISVAGFNSARDLIQVSYRCRHLIDNIIKIAYIENYNSHNTYINDSFEVDHCPVYQCMVKNIITEKQAPLKQSFLYLCNKAHYKILPNMDKANAELDKYFKTLFEDDNIYYGYNHIPNVSYEELGEIEQRICLQTATTEDKAIIKKYYYKKQFEKVDEIALATGWDNRYNFFFERVSELNHKENNIYSCIQNFNKWESIFPSDEQLNKVKLNDELIDRIFEEYHFKDLKKNSTPKSIIKNIYNAFFGKTVIGSKTKDKKNYSLTINQTTHEMYKYGVQYLKRYEAINIEDIDFINIFNDV